MFFDYCVLLLHLSDHVLKTVKVSINVNILPCTNYHLIVPFFLALHNHVIVQGHKNTEKTVKVHIKVRKHAIALHEPFYPCKLHP